MSLTKDKREAAKRYLLEQIANNDRNPVKKTAEAFEIDKASVYAYIRNFVKDGILEKTDGKYVLIPIVNKSTHFDLDLIGRDERDESRICEEAMFPYIDSLPLNIVGLWKHICTEMVNNVLEHSNANNLDIQVIRDYLNTTILIKDDGVGIFNKIKDHFGYTSLDDAIEELFKGKLTTASDRHSGEGIFFSSRMADVFAAISSGKQYLYSNLDSPITELTAHVDKGTIIFARISNNCNRDTNSVFKEYEEIDENNNAELDAPASGYSKTTIPMKYLFDQFPVSRSQAKRLSRRLEIFSEVKIDFKGIDSIGQGFADELFRVYQNSHPDVKIIPINCNENVERMLRHVEIRGKELAGE